MKTKKQGVFRKWEWLEGDKKGFSEMVDALG